MKKAELHTTIMMHCKAREVWPDLFSTNQGNGSKMTFVAGTNNVHMKNLKTWLWLDDMMQATFCRYQLYSDGRFEHLTNSGRSLTWAYKAKALNSSW